jgi:hypothetical protein
MTPRPGRVATELASPEANRLDPAYAATVAEITHRMSTLLSPRPLTAES